MSKVVYEMSQEQILDAIEEWLKKYSKILKLPNAIHYNLRTNEKGFSVEITEKDPS